LDRAATHIFAASIGARLERSLSQCGILFTILAVEERAIVGEVIVVALFAGKTGHSRLLAELDRELFITRGAATRAGAG
jgi:hypothetical protein